MSLHPIRKNSESAVQSETTAVFSSVPVLDAVTIQNAVRTYLTVKMTRKALTAMIMLQPSDEKDAIEHLSKTPISVIPDILTEPARIKLSQLPPFESPYRVIGGDYAGPTLLSDGSIYDGQWKDGKRLGNGRFFTASGGLLEGIWNNGLHLYGRVVYPNGDHYEGQYRHMKRNGIGTFQSLYRTVEYKGSWAEDKKHGFGSEILSDGSRYTGYFEGDLRHGQGTLTKANGEVYEGNFKDGKQNGPGTWTRPDGKTYEGDWLNGVKHGKGTLTTPHSVYVGDFVQGKKQGMGVLKCQEYRYEGPFLENKRHGEGLLSWNGGEPKPCVFVKNKQIVT